MKIMIYVLTILAALICAYATIIGIINYNLEREQKDALLETKINELRGIFEKQSLDSLKSLKFDIKSNEINYKQNGKSKSSELVGEVQEE